MKETDTNEYEATDTRSMVMYRDLTGTLRQLNYGAVTYNLDVIKRSNDIKADLKRGRSCTT